MLQEDPERNFLQVHPSRIAALYEGANQPLVQPQGRAAQAARGVVVAMQGQEGFEVVVALNLVETGENVIYAGEPVEQGGLPQAIEEALNFAESMGFILDASGWPNLDDAHKAELVGRIPVFKPPELKIETIQERQKVTDPLTAVARLFAAFCVLLMLSCSGMSAEQKAQAADIHQQLGDNLLAQGDAQQALKEYLTSLDFEETPEAHNGVGLIYAFSLGRPDDGEKEFKRALEMRPDYAEAMTNLGAVYLSRSRFGEAIPLFEKAARDPLYKSRVLAQSNLGWALYKVGQAERGVSEIKAALVVAPKYCLGWRQLGSIYSDLNRLDDAGAAYAKYAEACPDVADAHLSLGKVLVRQSKAQQARAEFERCAVPRDEKDKPVASECARFLKEMGTP
ncbi:MAG TPA: tetratricopeptide repeat protein [Myxococcales bacterium]|nr:tetratricopeptide repeat protein [Myxococcales bacterium]